MSTPRMRIGRDYYVACDDCEQTFGLGEIDTLRVAREHLKVHKDWHKEQVS